MVNLLRSRKILAMIVMFFSIIPVLISQNITQKIKGKVFDSEIHYTLPGSTVVILGSDPLIGTITDANGNFELPEVPLGRVDIKVSFIGYEDYIITGLMVSSQESPYLEIPLKEVSVGLDEVVVKDKLAKEKALNSMAMISARTISLDEAQRFAGSMEDFSRLAASFAGVSSGSIDNNEVIIRGNPAKGILWRLEGMEIPVPNHLAHAFNGGGVVSMFSPFMMANSDFFSGAFPAEYGNVLSGVFDINFRTGNPDKGKYGIQIGSFGVDAAAEGPFKKGSRSTYLVNARLSTFSILGGFLPVNAGLPDYGDLAFNLDFPTKKAGVFSLWSLSGYGKIEHEPDKSAEEWETSFDNIKYKLTYGMTATGLNHKKIIGKRSYLSSSLSFSGYSNSNTSDQYNTSMRQSHVANIAEEKQSIRFKSVINHKFGPKHTIRGGIIANQSWYNFDNMANTDPSYQDTLDFVMNEKGNTYTMQAFSQSLVNITPNLSMNAGLHFIYFGLNGKYTVDPRIAFKWDFAPTHSFALAYGKHSRIEPLRIYLVEVNSNGNTSLANKSLEITKAHHFAFSYDWNINSGMHMRIEPYYQYLYDVPVSPDSSFSMINYQNDMFFNSALDNSGTGYNYGIDLTFERYMRQGYYYMITGSVYQSKFKGGDGVERNTRLNQNYVLNLLGGKEWKVKENNFISVNGKFSVVGGTRYTPTDDEASREVSAVVYDMNKLYDGQWSTNYYVDLSVNYKINRQKLSHNFILQLKNLGMQDELIGFSYNYLTRQTQAEELAIVLPYISYKIEF